MEGEERAEVMGKLEDLTSLLEEVQQREGTLTPAGVGQALIEAKLEEEWPPSGEEKEALQAHIKVLTRQKRSLRRNLRELEERQQVTQEMLLRALEAALQALGPCGSPAFLDQATLFTGLYRRDGGRWELEQALTELEELVRDRPAGPAPIRPPEGEEALWIARLRESYLDFLAQFPQGVEEEDPFAALRRRIEEAPGATELLALRPEINRAVKNYAAGLFRERSRAADFVVDMGSRLEAIESALGRSADHNQAFQEANEEFSTGMSSELKGLIRSVAGEGLGLEELKQEVLLRFTAIKETIEDKCRQDERRLHQATTSLEEMHEHVQGVQAQVSRVREENRVLQEQLEKDELTGLPNRHAYDKRAAGAYADFRESGGDWALLVIDVDHFKKINDTYGHAVGDRMLRALGEQFCKFTRGTDFIARYGGEEFAAILADTDPEGAAAAAEKLRVLIAEERFLYRKRRVPVTVSIGFTSFLATDEGPEQIFRRADRALYRAKEGGRNRVERGRA